MTDEPPVGAVVVEDTHVWMHRADGWYGCLTCGDDNIAWGWEVVLADIGRASWRVVLP